GVRTIFVKVLGEPNGDVIGKISGLPNVMSAERYGNDIEVRFKGEIAEQAEFFKAVDVLGIKVYSLSESDNGLESTYLDLIKESR
ncbi:MAG: ABC transporter ATP-binding protein, partial [Candidatus Methanomethylophilaceae archaeon]